LENLDVEPEIIFLLNLEQMCETFSCLPKDILAEDTYYLNAFQAIIRGRQKGIEARGEPTINPKQLKKF
jgi:hypothetical protein